MFHFAFFLKVFKKNNKKKILQEIYDQIFKYLELSVREMGYGDATINKKMKNYLNTFHSILDQINDWEIMPDSHKTKYLRWVQERHGYVWDTALAVAPTGRANGLWIS